MGKQFRVRVHAKQAPGQIRKGTSSSSCPGYSKNREIAKAARTAFRQRLIAVDDRPEKGPTRKPRIDNVLAEPLENMDIEHKQDKKQKRKRILSMQMLSDDDEKPETKKEPELYPNMVMTPIELDTKISRVGQMLSSAVSSRTKQRSKLLSEIRVILKQVEGFGMPAEHVEVVSKYAKHYLPLLFRVYTEPLPEQGERPLNNDKEVKLSAFETARIYMPFVPQDLATVHANLALKKLQNDAIKDDRKILVVNILVALCKRVGNEGATQIFNEIHPWFLSDAKRKSLQKKAYRILTELYKRRDDPQLTQFFEYIQPTVADILRLEVNQISEPAWAARLAVFRLILRSLDNLEVTEQFYTTVFSQIIVGMDRGRNSLTRQNAAKCFQELISKMLSFCEDKEDKESLRLQILDSVETRIFEYTGFSTKSSKIALEVARSSLIAMNILAQQQLKNMNGALVSRFLNHAIVFLADNRPVVRVLAIRLMRIFCKKLPDFMINQFQDYILESVFSTQKECDNTGTVRRANRLLFEILVEKFGYEVVCKYAQGQEGLLKFLKTLEKKRRRKLAPPSDKKKSAKFHGDESDSSAEEDKMTAISDTRTICADSIFKLLEESDEAASDEDDDDVKSRVAQSMVSIKEFRKALQRSETAAAQKIDKSKKLPKGMSIADDGRFVIEDLEGADDEEESENEDENDY